MYTINKTSQAIIGEVLGKDYNEIVNMDYDEEIQYIQKINHKKLKFSTIIDKRKVGRGNPLLSRKKIRTIDKVNKGL